MNPVATEFLYEDNFIVICKAVYETEGQRTIHIDVGYKDEFGDIIYYRTIAVFDF